LQAIGYDARGRKQYRYHPLYRQVRNHTKFSRMLDFGKALPPIRKRVQADLSLHGLPREKVLGTVVRLLETTCMRIGNVEYVKENDSFGLTTLRDKHAKIGNGKVLFSFRGKSGLHHEVEVTDRRLAKIIKECRDLPGHELFQYLDDAGRQCVVDSSDVNGYLRAISGQHFTAKDFRTWSGTVQCALALEEIGPFESETEAKRNIVAAIKVTAHRLGNLPSTCRNYYVHPAILDSYTEGALLHAMQHAAENQDHALEGLNREELCVMSILKKRQQTSKALDCLSGAAYRIPVMDAVPRAGLRPLAVPLSDLCPGRSVARSCQPPGAPCRVPDVLCPARGHRTTSVAFCVRISERKTVPRQRRCPTRTGIW
jgi:DNA topoisomerase-1